MPPSLVINHDCIILDACCLINIHASGHMKEILECVPKSVAVAAYVKEREIKSFSLEPFLKQKLLRVVAPKSEQEYELLANFATQMDDGESVTGAIALSRNWAIGTDDRRAIEVIQNASLAMQIVSSLALLKNWTDERGESEMMIRNCLFKLKRDASYSPGEDHELYPWWKTHALKNVRSG